MSRQCIIKLLFNCAFREAVPLMTRLVFQVGGCIKEEKKVYIYGIVVLIGSLTKDPRHSDGNDKKSLMFNHG